MEQPAAGSDPLRSMAILAGRYAAAFAAGALIAFVYSYAPLHASKNWKIDYLEERLAAKDGELAKLKDSLQALEADSSGRPDAAAIEVLQDELATSEKTVKRLEEQVARVERRAAEAEQSRDQWQSRHAELERARSSAVAARAAAPQPDEREPVPAAPAPADGETYTGVAGPAPFSTAVRIGTRWRSADGRSDFDLVAVEGGRARVVPDPSMLRPGVAPTTLWLAAGERFEIAAPGGAHRSVLVRSIDATSGIEIELSD